MSKLGFWLPLPLLGLAFWVVTEFVTERSLQLSHQSIDSFQINPAREQASTQILFIKVTVDRDRHISQVTVKKATPVYQKEEFELSTTEMARVETAISRKLGLSLSQVRQLLRYQLKT
ncbi:MAG: hypothetical protein AB4368_22975 [Xenococcaceae cyanobacterium]